jgi:GNAT superfamily N-acetyltransferase
MPVRYRTFDADHFDAVAALCLAEGWPSIPEDRGRGERALCAPGVTTVVALDGDDVVGFATMLSDGQIQAYLSVLVVAGARRGEGIGRRLVAEAFRRAGGRRVDVLAAAGSEGFYTAMSHRRLPGFRVYPSG